MDNFSGKNVLITGASSGIGLAMAKDFANRGANLILTARSEDKLMQLAKDLSGKGIKTHVFIEDISLPNSAQKLFNQVNEAGLKVDVLVNNAGYGRWGNFDECPIEDYENMASLIHQFRFGTSDKDLGRKYGVICNLPGVLKV